MVPGNGGVSDLPPEEEEAEGCHIEDWDDLGLDSFYGAPLVDTDPL